MYECTVYQTTEGKYLKKPMYFHTYTYNINRYLKSNRTKIKKS